MTKTSILGIILAAGKGTRMGSTDINKTCLKIGGKPLIRHATDLLLPIVDQLNVVVGFQADSVKKLLPVSPKISTTLQTETLGTGHAVSQALKTITDSFTSVIVGYGDHMYFYQPEDVMTLIANQQSHQAAVSFVTTLHDNPNELAWGRVIRAQDKVQKIVEQKDATELELQVQEINAGFYCFDWQFLTSSITKLNKSTATGEYYITDLIEMGLKQKLPVIATQIPFDHIGYGVNTPEQLEANRQMWPTNH